MPRIRSIKPEFWDNETIASLPRDARLLLIGMWNYADDYGVVRSNPVWLKSRIFPYDEIQLSNFKKWLEAIEKTGLVVPFHYKSESYYFIANFLSEQVINRPSETRNVPQGVIDDLLSKMQNDSCNTHGGLTAGVGEGKEEDKEWKGEGLRTHEPDDLFDFSLNEKKEGLGSSEQKSSAHQGGGRKKPLDQTRSNKPDILFSDSVFADKELFKTSFIGTDYEHANLDYYHEVIKNWSDSKQAKKKDWLATAKNWMLSDYKEGKLVTHNSFNNGQSGAKPSNSYQKNTSGIDLDALAAIMRS